MFKLVLILLDYLICNNNNRSKYLITLETTTVHISKLMAVATVLAAFKPIRPLVTFPSNVGSYNILYI